MASRRCSGGLLIGLGILVGALVGGGSDSAQRDEVSPPAVPAAGIGNSARGEQVWTAKSSSMCHSYDGEGGADAPPLNYMRGDLDRGHRWHVGGHLERVPDMLSCFREEKIPFPSISSDRMADLIAYLHSGPTPVK